MFKKVATKDGSPVFIAKAIWYTVARDEIRFFLWTFDLGKKLGDMLKASRAEDNLECESSDIFIAIHNIEKTELNCYSSIPSLEEEGEHTDILYQVAFSEGIKYTIATRNGRQLTKEERQFFKRTVEKVFSISASMAGAIYMEVEIDGKRSIWYDENSCYEACEVPPDRLTEYDLKKEIIRRLKEQEL